VVGLAQQVAHRVGRPGGAFSFEGLDEGVYVVDIESPEHQRQRTEPVELRVGGGSPHLVVALARELHVSVVTARQTREPLAEARVELRTPAEAPAGERSKNAGLRLGPRSRDRGALLAVARTEERGTFELRNAPPVAARWWCAPRTTRRARRRSTCAPAPACLDNCQGTPRVYPLDHKHSVISRGVLVQC
jgi:hypothetical protein